MPLLASAVIPVDGAATGLERSVDSALGQTVDDIEVLIVGNGADDDTRRVAETLASADERVRFLDNPKGSGDGEAHRVRALAEARGEIICYLNAGDLWLPQHVETVGALLVDTDFAHTVALAVHTGGGLGTQLLDLADLHDRRLVLHGTNRIALSTLGHTLAAYRKLPLGWRTDPGGSGDLSFHQQWLAEPWVRARSGTRPTAVTFPADRHGGWHQRPDSDETDPWAGRIADPSWLGGELPWLMFDAARTSWRDTDRELRRITGSAPWQAGLRWVKRARKVQTRLQKYR